MPNPHKYYTGAPHFALKKPHPPHPRRHRLHTGTARTAGDSTSLRTRQKIMTKNLLLCYTTYMKTLLYPLLAMICFIVIAFSLLPYSVPVIFIAATLFISLVTFFTSWKWSIVALLVTSTVALLSVYIDEPTHPNIIIRYVGFVLTNVIISYIICYLKYIKKEKTLVQLKHDRLASIVEFSQDAITSKSLDGTILSWNNAAQQLYGYSYEEVIGKNASILLPEGAEPEEIDTTVTNKQSVRKRKDGSLITVSLSISPIFNADKKVEGASVIARDISNQKKLEEKLEKTNERYKAFIEDNNEAIWLIEYRPPIDISWPKDLQKKHMLEKAFVVEANRKMKEIYNVSDVIEKRVADFMPMTLKLDEILEKYIDSNYSLSNLETDRSTPEKPFYLSSTTKGIIKNGFLVRGWMIQRDVTHKRLQADELEKSKERYKAFIENSDEAICRIEFTSPIDTNLPVEEQISQFFDRGYIAEANVNTAKMLKVDSTESIINKSLNSLGLRSSGDDIFMVNFIKSGYTLSNFESHGTDKEGNPTYEDSSMKGIVVDNKWLRSWLVRRDITSQKQYVLERENLLHESVKAKQALEVASAEKDRFLANLSHELRTPLVSILGYSALLVEKSTSDPDITKMAAIINKNAKLQVQLIEDLLDLSRIISGKIELNKDFFDLSEMLRDAVATIRPIAEAKGLKVEEDYKCSYFYGDRKRLLQVVLNLLSNAVKFTEKGKVSIKATCTKDMLTIAVKDTGIGIDKPYFKTLFKPFKQVDSSSTRRKQGLGLGLSIVQNITDLHEGKTQVKSDVGIGSEFKIYLPVKKAGKVKKQALKFQHFPLHDVKILLTEDDTDTAGFISYLYESKGAHVDWAKSANEARVFIDSEGPYNVYIFDLSMPDEDGISLIKSIRALKDETRAIALTAFVDAPHEKEALEAGFDAFLRKPATPEELVEIVNVDNYTE